MPLLVLGESAVAIEMKRHHSSRNALRPYFVWITSVAYQILDLHSAMFASDTASGGLSCHIFVRHGE